MAVPLICDVVTVDRLLSTGEVTQVVVPAIDGEMAFLNLRAPILAALSSGEVRLTVEGGNVSRFVISGGYAQMSNGNKVIVLADHAVPRDKIDVDEISQKVSDLEKSLDDMAEDDANRPWTADQLAWCRLQLKYAGPPFELKPDSMESPSGESNSAGNHTPEKIR